MKLFGYELNLKNTLWFALQALLILDIFLITVEMIFNLPEAVLYNIHAFDFFVCMLLLADWFIGLYKSTPKRAYLTKHENIIALIASIPFDVILPIFIPQVKVLRYLRLLNLLRVLVLFNRFINGFEKFLIKTNLHKIIVGVLGTTILFTFLLYFFGETYDIFDDLYFVVVTLTTVGYGDIVPITFNEKIISLVLLFVGIFVFSTITAAISSFLTERLMEDTGGRRFESMDSDLKEIRKENEELKREIMELKELIKKD